MKKMFTLMAALALAGCLGYTEPVLLRNTVGMTAQCGPYPREEFTNSVADRESRCITDYQHQGYERTVGQ